MRFVLLHPGIAENVGAAARALKNFGWRDWSIVRPGFEDWEPARRMAVQSLDVLDGAERCETWEEAVNDAVWVVGTSSRRRRGQRSLTPREWATTAIEQQGRGPVALVFGEERSGLPNELLDRCHDVSTVPTDEGQPSMNLAQTVSLYAYELRLAADGVRDPPALPVGATHAAITALQVSLTDALRAAGFLRDAREGVVQELLTPLVRARLTRDEARLWTAAAKALGRSGGRPQA